MGQENPARPATPNRPRHHRGTWLCLVLLVAATAASFTPTLRNAFVDWDDFQCLRDNGHIRELNAGNLRWMATTGHMAQWQPLAWLAFGLQYQIFAGESELAFSHGIHAVNVTLHLVVTILCFFLIRRLLALNVETRSTTSTTADASPSTAKRVAARAEPNAATGSVPDATTPPVALNLAALAGSLFYGLHPLRVEVVAWATAQPYIMATVFCIASVLGYLRACSAPSSAVAAEGGSRRKRWLIVAWVLYGLSLLCKPIGVPLVMVLALLDWYPLGRLGGERGWTGAAARPVWLEKVPYLVLAVSATLLATWAKGGGASTMSWAAHGPLQRLAQACYGLVFYPWKTVIPAGLSPLCELQLPLELTRPRYLVAIVVVLLVAIWLSRYGRRFPALTVAVVAYAMLIFPVLGFLQSGNQEVADRYGYLPCVSCAVLAGSGLFWVWQRHKRSRWLRATITVAAAVTVVVLVLFSRQQGLVWRDTAALWTHAAALQENSSLAQNGYGFVLLQAGQVDAAIPYFRRAIQLKADNDVAHRNLWSALQQKGDLDALVLAIQDALHLFPEQGEFHRFLGNAFYRQRKYAEAVAAYQRGLAIQPDDAATHAALAGAYLARNESELARHHAKMALALDPNQQLAQRVLQRIMAP